MAADKEPNIYCQQCHRTRGAINFYLSYNVAKYPPNGRINICKDCLGASIDNFDKDTFLWILQELDVPYIPQEWNNAMKRYVSEPEKMRHGIVVLGRYISSMRLSQWKKFRWKDNEGIQQLLAAKLSDSLRQAGKTETEIVQEIAQGRQIMSIDASKAEELTMEPVAPDVVEKPELRSALSTDLYQVAQETFSTTGPTKLEDTIDLSDEDKTYLRLKWGNDYRPIEWVQLEQLYKDMTESFDVQTAAHIDTLKLLCKTSLKCNQLIDSSDIEGYQKMSKVYDQLMKAGNFTAAQNKGDDGEAVDSVGEIVAMCEKEGFIPRYFVQGPKDKVDETIEDLQRYTYTLVTQEMGLGNLIESSLKRMTAQENKPDESDNGADLTVQDFEAFNQFLDENSEHDDGVI